MNAVLGFLVAHAESLPASSIYADITARVALPYFALEMSLNILCTVLIIIPLLRARASVTQAIGKEYGRMYTSITAIMVESALPNALFSLVFIVLYAKQNIASNLIITPMLQVQVRPLCYAKYFLFTGG
jgi:ABC-type microcin C transport system permease subunit YejB